MRRKTCAMLWVILSTAGLSPGARLKDLATIEGVRENQLIGYGIVVGLAGTGDRRQTVFSAQSLTNLLERMGLSVSPTAIRVTNTAAVMVTATLPPFSRSGVTIDVTASAMGDATNLQGGILLLTSLRGVDGRVYAVAQGPVLTGGFSAGGMGTTKTVNHPTVGRVPNGATVERAAPSALPAGGLRWQLRNADFTTASRIADVINKTFPGGVAPARPENSGSVLVTIPATYKDREIQFIAELEALKVETDRAAKIVVNERTGTIVMGKEVAISPVTIMHGALSIEIQTTFAVSQPAPFSQGSTQVVPQVNVGVTEEKAKNVTLPKGASVEALVKALGSIGATPRDVIAILQNLRAAGALEAELEVL